MDFLEPIVDAVIWGTIKGVFLAIWDKLWVIFILIVLIILYKRCKFLRGIIKIFTDFIVKFLL